MTLQRKSTTTNKPSTNGGGGETLEHESNENLNSQHESSTTPPNLDESEMSGADSAIAGSLTTTDSVGSKISEFINTNLPHLENSINNHNESIINEPTASTKGVATSSGSTSLKRHESASSKKRATSKGKSTHKPQTQSMSNITVPALVHSASDNDLDQSHKSHHLHTQNMSIEPEDYDVGFLYSKNLDILAKNRQ